MILILSRRNTLPMLIADLAWSGLSSNIQTMMRPLGLHTHITHDIHLRSMLFIQLPCPIISLQNKFSGHYISTKTLPAVIRFAALAWLPGAWLKLRLLLFLLQYRIQLTRRRGIASKQICITQWCTLQAGERVCLWSVHNKQASFSYSYKCYMIATAVNEHSLRNRTHFIVSS